MQKQPNAGSTRPRTAARVIVVRNDCVLVIHNRESTGDWYLLPGGGQVSGESLEETAIRECREETGIEARIDRLLCTHELIWPVGTGPSVALTRRPVYQVEAIFLANAVGEHADREPIGGTVPADPDRWQIGVVWLAFSDIGCVRFFPRALTPFLTRGGVDTIPAYLLDRER